MIKIYLSGRYFCLVVLLEELIDAQAMKILKSLIIFLNSNKNIHKIISILSTKQRRHVLLPFDSKSRFGFHIFNSFTFFFVLIR